MVVFTMMLVVVGTSWQSALAAPTKLAGVAAQADHTLVLAPLSVSADSPTDAWAVGLAYHDPGVGTSTTLTMHWDGTSWSRVASPSPGSDELRGVSAISPDDAWAVGTSFVGTVGSTLVGHWDGSSWTQVPSPSPGPNFNMLSAVSARSSTDVWAVGNYNPSSASRGQRETLILHWDGSRWSQVPSPSPGPRKSFLSGVTATSRNDAWAVGNFHPAIRSASADTLALHWDGTTWSQVPSPSPGGTRWDGLAAVAATSSRHAWAVGAFRGSTKGRQTLNERWNGTQWTQVFSPNPGPTRNHLAGVTATSPTDVWAVGDYSRREDRVQEITR
jgi:hypothetical protein